MFHVFSCLLLVSKKLFGKRYGHDSLTRLRDNGFRRHGSTKCLVDRGTELFGHCSKFWNITGICFSFFERYFSLFRTCLQVSKYRKLVVITAYLGVLVFAALITMACLQGVIPVFFIQGIGATALRQFMLGGAIVLFATSSLLFIRLYFKSKSDVLYWYSLAMVLITESLFSWFFAKAAGSPISWAGRVAVYLSAIYFLVAILILVRGVRKKMKNEKSQYEEKGAAFLIHE